MAFSWRPSLVPRLHRIEYALKSAFLYNFCRFIDWPDSAFASPSEPFIIGIAGDDPFGSLLTEAIKGKKYHNRPIRIDHFRGPGDIKRCHLLFISHANAGRPDPILAGGRGKERPYSGRDRRFSQSRRNDHPPQPSKIVSAYESARQCFTPPIWL